MRTRKNNPITTSHYMGAGAKQSVFSRKSTATFSKIKAIYGDEMQRLQSDNNGIAIKKLSETEQQVLRLKITMLLAKQKREAILRYTITAIIIISLITISYFMFFN